MNINHRGSLMTVTEADGERCLGSLMDFKGHGVFEPSMGKVDVTPEEASIHNKCLDEANIKGLDSCEVGLYGMLYFSKGEVHTFTGATVSKDVRLRGKVLTFSRNGRTFRGTLRKDQDLFCFKRVA